MSKRILVLEDDIKRVDWLRQLLHFKCPHTEITHVWDVFDFKVQWKEDSHYDLIILDHDLGLSWAGEGDLVPVADMSDKDGATGLDAAKFLADYAREGKYVPFVVVWSWNPQGADMMVQTLREVAIPVVARPFSTEATSPLTVIIPKLLDF